MSQIQNIQAPGTLDPGFAVNGKAKLPFLDITGIKPAAVLALDDKKLLVAIGAFSSQAISATLVRLTEDGELDQAFGVVELPSRDGAVFHPEFLFGLEVGGWLVVGWLRSQSGGESISKLAVIRQNENGETDNTYGDGGMSIISVDELLSHPGEDSMVRLRKADEQQGISSKPIFLNLSAAVHKGKIVLGSEVFFSSVKWRGIVFRLDTFGKLDFSFNGSGFTYVDLPDLTEHATDVHGVAIQADSKVLVCGNYPDGNLQHAYVMRYDQWGGCDKEFGPGKNGIVVIHGSATVPMVLNSITPQSDGNGILAVGANSDYGKVDGEPFIIVLNNDGNFRADFNNGNPLFFNDLKRVAWNKCLSQPDNKIVVLGAGLSSDSQKRTDYVARILPSGQSDLGFANGGLITIDEKSYGRGIALRTDGRIIVTYSDSDYANTEGTVACYFS
ncbi:delta-60 repeat domain-containing protein [Pseudomonas sp. URMO17WK12:I12]|jgi:uncharacterized delta-60 repeat protein|uniref:delta-60 repeat domain-containing protein n=1 Tax=Pseudomonas sp. URMO17WK12:I12 TaxID=1259797 RepID=UPI0004ACE45B|nr:delta-60 repeat domain-containing protein [Pseudomonas sp. URMO17WK12:I12]